MTTKPESETGLIPAEESAPPETTSAAPVRMGLAPRTIEEAYRLAKFIASSELAPKGYRGKPMDILVAMQFGMEVGLPPMAALHSIYVTNGRPALYGDGLLAVVMASPVYRGHTEFFLVAGEQREGLVAADLLKDDTGAVCAFTRADTGRTTSATFTIAHAKKAGLWGKEGPWQTYPDRMLRHRARGFAAHDTFPDVLRGIPSDAEVQDLPPVEAESERTAMPEVRRASATPPAPEAIDPEVA